MHIVNALTAADSPNPHGISARELLSTEHAQVVMVTFFRFLVVKTPRPTESTRLL